MWKGLPDTKLSVIMIYKDESFIICQMHGIKSPFVSKEQNLALNYYWQSELASLLNMCIKYKLDGVGPVDNRPSTD